MNLQGYDGSRAPSGETEVKVRKTETSLHQ